MFENAVQVLYVLVHGIEQVNPGLALWWAWYFTERSNIEIVPLLLWANEFVHSWDSYGNICT